MIRYCGRQATFRPTDNLTLLETGQTIVAITMPEGKEKFIGQPTTGAALLVDEEDYPAFDSDMKLFYGDEYTETEYNDENFSV